MVQSNDMTIRYRAVHPAPETSCTVRYLLDIYTNRRISNGQEGQETFGRIQV